MSAQSPSLPVTRKTNATGKQKEVYTKTSVCSDILSQSNTNKDVDRDEVLAMDSQTTSNILSELQKTNKLLISVLNNVKCTERHVQNRNWNLQAQVVVGKSMKPSISNSVRVCY